MISILFAVRDSAANVFGRVFQAPTVAFAIRAFSDEVNRVDPENTLFSHPADYNLYRLGTYDDVDGHLVSTDPVHVFSGAAARVAGVVAADGVSSPSVKTESV